MEAQRELLGRAGMIRFLAQLLNAARNLDAELGEEDDYGQRYVIDLEVTGPTGTAQVHSAWIIRHDEDFPRFVSCYVL